MKLVLLAVSLFASATAVHAAPTPAPRLLAPAQGTSNWLFNGGAGFTWQAIPNATYRIVVSSSSDFRGFRDQQGASSCDSTCVTYAGNSASANKVNLRAMTWVSGTYYWRVRASTPTGGTSAWSPVYSFTTSAFPDIVNRASAYIGKASPASMLGSPWATDISDSDGARMRNAFVQFKGWVDSKTGGGGYSNWVNRGRQAASSTVQSAMRRALAPSYATADQTKFIERIRQVYNGTVPQDGQPLLDALGIRAQCKEFADRMVRAGGGSPKTYNASASSDVKPGMYAMKTGLHAAIISAVRFDASGVAYASVVEANASNVDWGNPKGEVPWLRTVRLNSTGYAVGPGQAYKAVAP